MIWINCEDELLDMATKYLQIYFFELQFGYKKGSKAMNDIGLKIKNRRLELGLTQEELAKKVGYKTKGSINKLETTRDIPIKKLKPIADALDIDIKVLMGWEDNLTEETGAMLADYVEDVELFSYMNKIKQASPEVRKKILSMIDILLSE